MSSDLVDAVIAITVLEGLGLALYHRVTGRGMAPRDYVANLSAGLALMLALRAVLSSASWTWVAAALLLSGLMHATDLRSRWLRGKAA